MSDKLRKYLKDIEDAAHFFNTHFVGKEIIYCTETQSVSIKFKDYHFLHLCGLRYEYGAKQFFKAVLSRKLNLSKVSIKEDGTTLLKLPLLKSIDLLISREIRLTDGAFYLELSFDKAIKTSKMIFALTLSLDQNSEFYPNSLLNLKTMNRFPNGESIISIKSIDLKNRTEIVYF